MSRRELKFKVWDKLNKRWYTWDEIKTGIMHVLWSFPHQYIPVQYTGRKDKNDNEIYERYIVKGMIIDSGKRIVGEVVWDEQYTGYEIDYGTGLIAIWELTDIEVIGNSCENPELLKEC